MATKLHGEALVELVWMLKTAERHGALCDEPEGSRYIKVSDTLAKKICDLCGQIVRDEAGLT